VTDEKWTLSRGYIWDEEGNALASVAYTLGDEADHRRARLIVKAPELLELVGKLADALRLHHSGLSTTRPFKATYNTDAALLESVAELLERIEGR